MMLSASCNGQGNWSVKTVSPGHEIGQLVDVVKYAELVIEYANPTIQGIYGTPDFPEHEWFPLSDFLRWSDGRKKRFQT